DTFVFGSNGGGTLLNSSANFVNRANTFRTTGGARNLINASGGFFNFDTGTNTFDVARGTDATSDLTVNAVLANAGSVLKTGNGIVTLTAQNTFVGGTTVNAGTLVLNDTWNFGPSWPGIGVVRGNLTINQGATVELRGTGTGALGWADGQKITNLVINGGLLDGYNSLAGDGRQHIWNIAGGVNLTGGRMRINNGVSSTTATNYWDWGNTAVNSLASADSSEISGMIRIRNDHFANITFNVADGAATNDLIVSAAITQFTGASSLTKNGAGTMLLSGTNIYTGATTVSGGTLRAGTTSAFGVNSAVTIGNAAGATLDLNDFSQTIGSLAGGGAAGGEVKLGTATLTFGGLGGNLTYAGTITGTGNLIKNGSGVQTLTGANSYSGGTRVNAGEISIGHNTALGTGTVNLAATGVGLNAVANNLTVANAFQL
ncbi:hypothetical protein EBS57_10375, partial [bacterium]|nr:hypothetical protein [bacterium]